MKIRLPQMPEHAPFLSIPFLAFDSKSPLYFVFSLLLRQTGCKREESHRESNCDSRPEHTDHRLPLREPAISGNSPTDEGDRYHRLTWSFPIIIHEIGMMMMREII
jgi:hypothetical protein